MPSNGLQDKIINVTGVSLEETDASMVAGDAFAIEGNYRTEYCDR